jgi:AraC family transcriptional regulator of adaptative response/methylated-DNA-[protein]-cysteine methyltransferase
MGTAARQRASVEAACRSIESADAMPSLGSLAASAGMSPSRFRRVFTETTGITPKAYADAVRASRVRRVLGDGASTVTDAIYGAGFESSGRFYEHSTARLGMTPSEYRDGAPEIEVRFAVAETSLGPLLVAATDRGICAIEFGDDPEQLVIAVQERFRGAELSGDDVGFAALVAQVVGLVERPENASELALDIRGTAFQERVWRALQEVPPGRTVTYAELAQRIGSPTSVRAVAGACAANHVAVAVPCHRVIRSDGSLSGYRWGVERKRSLLAREGRTGDAS